MVTVRALITVGTMNGWDTCQIDVSNAFLHGDLFEEVYKKMPQGYASRQWFAKLSSTLLSFGFVQSKADYSLFNKSEKFSFTTILVYVDDLLITGSKVNKAFCISQNKYALELLTEAGLSNVKSYKLHMESHVKLQVDIGNPFPDPEFMQNPTSVHMQRVKPLLRYLLNSPGQGILLAHNSAIQLTAYYDSDWANCPMTRRSTTSYCILLGQSSVSWKSKNQRVVSRSLAKAEYRAMDLTCCEVTWLVSLLKDLGLKDLGAVDLKCDNKEAIYIAATLIFHARTKHIEIDCHYVRDQVKKGEVVPSHVSTKSQFADFLKRLIVEAARHPLKPSTSSISSSATGLRSSPATKDKTWDCDVVTHSVADDKQSDNPPGNKVWIQSKVSWRDNMTRAMVKTTNADSVCCLAADSGRMAEHESYTSFDGSMLIAFYLALMIFRICCLAADSGRMAECEITSGRVVGLIGRDSVLFFCFASLMVMKVGEIRSLSLPHKVNHMALLISLPKDRDMSNGSSIGFTSFGGGSGCVHDQNSETEQREARSTKEPEISFDRLGMKNPVGARKHQAVALMLYTSCLIYTVVYKLWKMEAECGQSIWEGLWADERTYGNL
ncbi:cysteine-rich receptor-like protein kinase 8 [Tanacetum coccineum]|uniref:Cysteine-rich receptor-like protein kinase 8 n=1 Tax=Tanacetum coccineum TaxID=301880 RepID=A0ABQ5I9G9_9ASTR